MNSRRHVSTIRLNFTSPYWNQPHLSEDFRLENPPDPDPPQAIRVSVGVEADVEASVQEHWLVWGPWKGRGFTGFFPIGIAIIGVWVFWVCCQVAKCFPKKNTGISSVKNEVVGICFAEDEHWNRTWYLGSMLVFFLCFVGAWLCKTSPKKWLKPQIDGFFKPTFLLVMLGYGCVSIIKPLQWLWSTQELGISPLANSFRSLMVLHVACCWCIGLPW